ncbi:MFS general substrate transporter [Rhizodiscina lignyota]|uniref:MFS general substrate transporter n=1 Tax=Rhizodiscina lignyota TaxID=1504668 RepID=A0A9P4I6R8_9PEZI|nr:MFS general substrate transporter [Rhizodiscina lignyota]
MEKADITEHNEAEAQPGAADDLKKSITVDTVHGDEAVKVLAAYAGDETWTAKEEKKLLHKIDRRLLSILCITYGLQYYDKAMLSQAAIFGPREDLELEVGNRYFFSASIFYLGFIVGAYPAILMAQRWPIERVASCIVAVWGACLMCTAACHNWKRLFAQRFFLEFLEVGISALRMGAWYCCTGYVSIVSPLINYGLGHIKGSLAPWRYMYIVAVAVTVLWGAALCHVHDAATDVRFWLMFSIAFLAMIANGPVSTFTPIIINSFGYSTLNSLLLIMPAGFTSGTLEILAPFLAYKIPRARTSAKGGLLIGVYFLPSFGAGYAVAMGLSIANNTGYTKRSVSSSGIFIGYCLGNFVGPLIFKPKDAPRYAPGFIAVIVTSAVVAVLSLVYRVVCVLENRKRDKAGIMESYDHAYEDDLTDRRNPQFRYTL